MELFQFQEAASAQVADKLIAYLEDPPVAGTAKKLRTIPFFQALSALTGSGKTLILAESVSQVADTMSIAPIVLWLSRGKVVVRQAYANLSEGGKYHQLLDKTRVMTLGDYKPDYSLDADSALLCFATVGTFNQKDKENGSLTIFQSDIDATETSTWEALKSRLTSSGVRRPLIVVYDEAHNLSDQQTELLLELEPDAFLLASATMRLPARLSQEVIDLRRAGWSEPDLITEVKTTAVVASGLVKAAIHLGGYNAPMEDTVPSLLADMADATEQAVSRGLPFRPKAIYVCNTNVLADDAFRTDDPKQPFEQREAAPIRIWRFLLSQGVDPAEIAVYANLKTHKDFPLPDDFNLFRGDNENDYEQFTAGDFKHIIFNLTLQEGWDDPSVYFAYVDKSMDSRVQVTQIVGRVLRQPDATRYPAERLNTAHFYVRVDKNETFNDVLKDVERQLGGKGGGIKIVASPPGKPKPIPYQAKVVAEVPVTGLLAEDTQAPIAKLLGQFGDYRADAVNTKGEGSRRISRQKIGEAAEESEWETFEQASRVSARWVLHREVQRRFRRVLDVINMADPKLNALVGIGSPAYHQVRSLAEQMVAEYIDNVRLGQRGPNPYVPGEVLARPDDVESFNNAVHEGYAGLNESLERPFAHAIDATGLLWARNPARTGYGIPLVSVGSTDNFYPDFLIWTKKRVICLDTKGGFLVRETAGRKLLNIKPKAGQARRVDVQFVSQGRWTVELVKEGPDGWTRWGLNDEGHTSARQYDGLEELVKTLIKDPS